MSGMEHEHLTPEELTELATGAENLEGLAAARACEQCGPQLRELEGFLTRSKDALVRASSLTSVETADLTRRILAETTAAEGAFERTLEGRGRLRLLGAELRSGLRTSRVLRLAAASLVAHLVALPVLAWYVFDRPEPKPVWITISPATEPAEFAETEAERLPPLPPAWETSLDGVMDAASMDLSGARVDPVPVRIENSIRLARFELSNGAPAMPAPGVGEDTVERLLRARAEQVAAFEDGLGLPKMAGLTEPSQNADGVELALQAELRLDAFVLSGETKSLDAALARLCQNPDEGRAATQGRESAAFRLEASALARAEAYGLLADADRARLSAARRGAVERSDELALLLLGDGQEPDGRRTPVLGQAWIEALDAALSDELRASGVVRAWLEHRR